MTQRQFCLIEAIRRKEAGMTAAANGYGAATWLSQARAVAEHLSAKYGEVTIDKVLSMVPRPPSVSVNATGSVFAGKGWHLLGYTPSAKPNSHARRIGIWSYDPHEN